jgi:hypothetical protein
VSKPEREKLDLYTASSDQILRAMRRGAAKALLEHKRAGNPVVVWDREADRIILLPPDEIPDHFDVLDEP